MANDITYTPVLISISDEPKIYTKFEVKMLCLDAMKWAMDNANDEVENFDPKQFFKLNNLD